MSEFVLISQLVFDPVNARKHDKKNIEAIKGSLARFGQQKPIIISKDNVVIAGNGTLAAAIELNWADIEVKRSNLTGAEAMAYALADNRTAELATWDDEILGKTLQALREDGFNIGEIGFDVGDFFDAPDYGALEGEPDPDFNGLSSGVRKAIQIEFTLEDFEEATRLVKAARDKGLDVGKILMERLAEVL